MLALESLSGADAAERLGRNVPAVAADLLDEVIPKNDARPADQRLAAQGHRPADADDQLLGQGGTHPRQAVAAQGRRSTPRRRSSSPSPGRARSPAPSASPPRSRTPTRPAATASPGGSNTAAPARRPSSPTARSTSAARRRRTKLLKIEKGDELILAVDAKNGDHTCDLTEIGFTVTETDEARPDLGSGRRRGRRHPRGQPARRQARQQGRLELRPRAVAGRSRKILGPIIPPASVLGRWREAAADPARRAEADKLAEQVQALLSGPRPAKEKEPDRVLYDNLVSAESSLSQGLDLTPPRQADARAKPAYGLAEVAVRQGRRASSSPRTPSPRCACPPRCSRDREFVVEGKARRHGGDRVVQFQVLTAPPPAASAGTARVRSSPRRPGRRTSSCSQGTPNSAACFPHVHLLPAGRPDRRGRDAEDVPPRGRAARSACSSTTSRSAASTASGPNTASSAQQPVGREQVPAAVHRLRDPGPAEGVAGLLREPARRRSRSGPTSSRRTRRPPIPKQLDALLDFAARAYRRPLTRRRRRPTCSACTRRSARRASRTTRRSAACWRACWCRRRSCSASSRRRRARRPARSTTGNWPRG